jgi:hypothetical protein
MVPDSRLHGTGPLCLCYCFNPYLALLLTPRVADEYVVEYLQGLHPEMTISKCLLQ